MFATWNNNSLKKALPKTYLEARDTEGCPSNTSVWKLLRHHTYSFYHNISIDSGYLVTTHNTIQRPKICCTPNGLGEELLHLGQSTHAKVM
jgi:hypothetical protein